MEFSLGPFTPATARHAHIVIRVDQKSCTYTQLLPSTTYLGCYPTPISKLYALGAFHLKMLKVWRLSTIFDWLLSLKNIY